MVAHPGAGRPGLGLEPFASPRRLALRGGADAVDGEVGAVEFLFGVEADTEGLFQHAIDHEAADQGHCDAHQRADDLRGQRHPAQPAQRLHAENARGNAAPGATQAVQRPDAQHVVDLPAVLRQGEHPDKQRPGNRADHQRA